MIVHTILTIITCSRVLHVDDVRIAEAPHHVQHNLQHNNKKIMITLTIRIIIIIIGGYE